jgi:plastocyanin
MRRTALLLAALALGVSCSGGDSSGGPVVEMLEGHRFDPGIAVVSAGTTVTFANESEEAHTVTAVDGVPRYFASGGFASEDEARDDLSDGLVAPGESYEVTFDEPGTYDYFCIPHEDEGMKGTIEVEE